MDLGIFSRTYDDDLETVFNLMNEDGFMATQFNLTSANLETMPLEYDIFVLDKIKAVANKYNIKLVALSGTFNMIDPDLDKRKDGIKRFEVLCEIAKYLDIPIISLCTGSKNPNSKWEWDDLNLTESSWADLLETTKQILPYAIKHSIILGVEPEASNIVNSSKKAREYLNIFNSEHIKIIMDGANLFNNENKHQIQNTLEEAFEYLGNDICLAHAKDIDIDTNTTFVAAGEGSLDFELYIKLLKKYNYNGPLIMHGLSEEQIDKSVTFLKEAM